MIDRPAPLEINRKIVTMGGGDSHLGQKKGSLCSASVCFLGVFCASEKVVFRPTKNLFGGKTWAGPPKHMHCWQYLLSDPVFLLSHHFPCPGASTCASIDTFKLNESIVWPKIDLQHRYDMTAPSVPFHTVPPTDSPPTRSSGLPPMHSLFLIFLMVAAASCFELSNQCPK